MSTSRLAAGSMIGGRFVLEQLAGSGGMGEVYRARDVQTQDVVAVKVLHRADGPHAARFLREARVLSQLEHPGIVRYVAHGDSPSLFLVMEWLEGEDLGHRLAREPLQVPEAVAVVRAIADALGAAHERGIVHRDIKPSNVYLAHRRIDRVRLLDFGIAFLAQGTRAMTASGQVLGTLGYMAPEQANEGRKVTSSADVFSLGCLLFECLSGRAAFPGDRLMEVLAKILFAATPRVSDVCLGVEPQLDELVARMMNKDPTARPALAEVIAELDSMEAAGALSTTRYPRVSGSPPSHARAAVSLEERRLTAVLLVDQAPSPGRPTSPTLSVDNLQRSARDLAGSIEPFGGKVEMRTNGATLVILESGDESATDLAARAARCALAVRGLQPHARLALTIGFGDPSVEEAASGLVRRAEALAEVEVPEERAVLVDPGSAGLLDGRFCLEGEGAVLELLREREPAAPPRLLLGAPTRLVGRERELALLLGVAEECLSEPVASAIAITAPPGAGKSRLAHELLTRLTREGERIEVWQARCDPGSASVPFALVGRLARAAFQVEESESAEEQRRAVKARLVRALGETDGVAAAVALGEILGARRGDEGRKARPGRPDDGGLGEPIRRAWEQLLQAETEAHPLVLVLEDMQWADRTSMRVIDANLRTLRKRPLLVVGLARPEVHEVFPSLWAERRLQEVRLPPLTPSATRKLVVDALGDAADAETIDTIVERSVGNAFDVEELIRGVARGQRDVPESVLAAVQARLARLEAPSRRLLRAGSVFGATFWVSGVHALMGHDVAYDTKAILADLEKREILTRVEGSRFADLEEWVFRHPLTRDAAYAMLPARDAREAHRAAAEWLEARGEREARILAHHLDAGGEPLRAVVWYLWAAEQELSKDAMDLVVALAERGIACGATGSVLGELRLLQAEASGWLRLPDHARRARESMNLLAPGTPAWCRAAAELAVASGRAGDRETLAQMVRAIAGTSPDDLVTVAHTVAVARAALALLEHGEDPHGVEALVAWLQAARGLAAEEDMAMMGALTSLVEAARSPAPVEVSGEKGAGDRPPMRERELTIVRTFREAGYGRLSRLLEDGWRRFD